MTAAAARRDVIVAFDEAVAWFLATLSQVTVDQWQWPGLGEWTVRELAGHAGRALSTIDEYLLSSPPTDQTVPDRDDEDPVTAAARYFLGLRDHPEIHRAVAERGRQAGAELRTDDAPGDLGALADRVLAMVHAAPEGAVFATRFGLQPFAPYLLSRIVELVVHTLDIARACALDMVVPDRAASATVAVIGRLAVERGDTAAVVEALGGRGPLPSGFGVFG